MQKKNELTVIPGIGGSIAGYLNELGVVHVSDLKNNDPQKLYDDFCKLRGEPIDRCLLYTFRCAVYFASHTKHNPELLKWWNWKEKEG